MDHTKIKDQIGYTLLEMTLVLAIIAVVVTFALKMYRDSTVTNRVNKVALEMQHVMEAALAYDTARGYWPVDNKYTVNPPASTDCASPTDLTFVNNYLPNQTNVTSYGVSVCWSGANNGTQTTPQNYQRFWVSVALPGNSIQIAQRVAALLPNAIATADQPQPFTLTTQYSTTQSTTPAAVPTACTDATKTCYIRAEVPLPATEEQAQGPGVKAVGYCIPKNQDTAGSQLVSNNAISYCTGSVCYTTPNYSSSSDIYCQQLAAPSLDAAGASGPDADYRRQYRITFSCPNGLHEKLYITPNFLQMPIYDKAVDYEQGRTAKSFYLVQPTLNASQYDCTNGLCSLVMQAYYGGDVWSYQSSPPQPQKVLITTRGRGYINSTPEEPGTVGATYVAMCVP